MYGNGCAGSTESGVSTGKMRVSNMRESSRCVGASSSSHEHEPDPEVAQAREQILAQQLVLPTRPARARAARIAASCSAGVRPSIERAPTSAAICVLRPATRTWKK